MLPGFLGRGLSKGKLGIVNYGFSKIALSTIVLTIQASALGGIKDMEPYKRRASATETSVETLYIDIKAADYEKLRKRRDQATYWGHLAASPGDYVAAKITHKNKTVKASVRLKGDKADHWKYPGGWSLRIKIKGSETILGMKTFAIQKPHTRSGVWEWLAYEMARREDVIVGRYDLIRGVVNGIDMGIYALEESFEKRLVEFNRRREGVILKFPDKDYWFEKNDGTDLGGVSYLTRKIDGFQSNKISKDPVLRRHFTTAYRLLNGFRHGDYRPRDVFDLKRVASALAISDIMGSWHAKVFNQLRFYYNPVLSKFELHVYDFSWPGELTRPSSGFWLQDGWEAQFYSRLFDDPEMFEAYIQAIDRICSSGYLEQLFEEVGPRLAEILSLMRDFPDKDSIISLNLIYANRIILRRHLVRLRKKNPWMGISVHPGECQKDRCSIVIRNMGPKQIEILGIQKGDKKYPLIEPLELAPAQDGVFTEKKAFVKIPDLNTNLDYKHNYPYVVRYREAGVGTVFTEGVRPWAPALEGFDSEDLIRSSSRLDDFQFLKIDEEEKKIEIMPGDWTLDKTLVIPQGYVFVAGAGVKLKLINRANIISYSPLKWMGSEMDPILIQAKGTGQGVAVFQAEEESVLEHVIFRGLSNPERAYWFLTGAVTFYESDVKIKNCQFLNSRCEDSLNLIRGRMDMVNNIFEDSKFDALDCDFVEGTIEETFFRDSGNDALDFSGSEIKVVRVTIDGAGDKGLSAGERSRILVEGMEIREVKVGVASKDASQVSLSRLIVMDSEVGLAVYQKKSEFGPGAMQAIRPRFERLESDYLIEEKSLLVLNGEKLEGKLKNLRDRMK